MPIRHRSARQRRRLKGRVARITAPVTIPVATVGARAAVTDRRLIAMPQAGEKPLPLAA